VTDKHVRGESAVFEQWVDELFARYETELRPREVARALAALTRDYVERRRRLLGGDALGGRGKRAAFALYYAPRHYAVLREVLRRLVGRTWRPPRILDLGCGVGVAGAAWSRLHPEPPPVLGIDLRAWVLAEARLTYRALGVPGRTFLRPLARLRWPAPPFGVVAAFTVNELLAAERARLLERLRRGAERGSAALVVEPLATRIVPWWPAWSAAFRAHGGRADEWKLDIELPDRVVALGRAAHLDPSAIGARTLWLPAARRSS
jgi:SAM-dependent methyltransferase